MKPVLPAFGTRRSRPRLARNTGLNILGQVLPAIIGLVAVPYILHGLGLARFGVLSLAWVVLAYLGLFDFGLGRATIRFVADALGKGDEAAVPGIVWTSLLVQVMLGIAGTGLVLLATPLLVEHALKVPTALVRETENVFDLLAISVPVLLCSASLKGVLEASSRFDLTNLVRTGSGSALFLAPALGVALHLNLAGIMVVLLVALVMTAVAYLALCVHVHPALQHGVRVESHRLRALFSFGGWVTVSSLTVPFLIYSDRFLLSILAGVAVLAYYTVPYDIVARLQILPGSLGAAIFPAFSATPASQRERLADLYMRGLRYLALAICPVALIMILAANLFLTLWLGPSFAAHGTLVLQLLAIGVVLNGLSQIPAQLLDGIGRPDLRAKILMAYLPPYLVIAWVLISSWGVNGAALAWLLRGCLELSLFFGFAAAQLESRPLSLLRGGFLPALLAFGTFAVAGSAIIGVSNNYPLVEVAVTVACGVLFATTLWIYALEQAERIRLTALAWGVGSHIGLRLRAAHK
jgi:O-antigen/teichoic acid export membrane protein